MYSSYTRSRSMSRVYVNLILTTSKCGEKSVTVQHSDSEGEIQ